MVYIVSVHVVSMYVVCYVQTHWRRLMYGSTQHLSLRSQSLIKSARYSDGCRLYGRKSGRNCTNWTPTSRHYHH